ncbi:MAG: rhomboid family intramembrane serine protease [Halioglobus sp.]|nr:rhomboid family intramembrane serine protease [Halioglobus sp.]
MSDFKRALGVTLDEDLKPLSVLLHRKGVAHRIFEQGGQQVLMVDGAQQAERVQALYKAWHAGELRIDVQDASRRRTRSAARVQWRRAPVTLCLTLLSIGGFLLYALDAPMSWIAALAFTPFDSLNAAGGLQAMGNQYWRLITPVFLHFSWLHIVFNCLWLWELGARIEQVMGHVNMLLLFLVIAVVSNVSQFIFGGEGLFGGMSGVVYGLLGFAWVAPILQPGWPIQPPKAVMVLMVGWLLVCMAGIVEALGFGAIANAAHLAGLLCGLLLGAAFGALSRAGGDNNSTSQV